MKLLLISLRMLLLATALLGVGYPLAVWMAGQWFFADAADGSLVRRWGRLVGSSLLAQKTSDPRLFWPRPSACDYATVPAGAGNQPWSSAALVRRLNDAPQAEGLATQSGSGVDPHQSEAALRAQLPRVAAARGWDERRRARAQAWILAHAQGGFIGPRYINVLELNLALDKIENEK